MQAANEVTPLYWADRQGPTQDGVIPEELSEKLPLEWDETTGKGIGWTLAIEGEGHCSPVIGGDLIWFTSATKDGKKMYVYAVNRHDGKLIHHKLIFENPDPEPLGNPMNNYAAPTCALDETGVYVHFGTYGTAKLDLQTAEKIWERRDINVSHYRGPGSSPILYKNLIILTYDGINKQFLTALEKETGKTVWVTPRTTDYGDILPDGSIKMNGDLRKGFGTPAIMKLGGKEQMLSVGSRAAFAYEPETGKEIWTIQHDTYNAASRPVFDEQGLVVINTGSERAQLIGLKIDENSKGNLTEKKLWVRDRRNATLASPLMLNGLVFQVTGAGVGVCVDAASGEELWSERLSPGKFVAAPIATQDKMYFISDTGAVTIVAPKREFQVISRAKFTEGVTATPAVAEGNLYVRTKTHLVMVKQKP